MIEPPHASCGGGDVRPPGRSFGSTFTVTPRELPEMVRLGGRQVGLGPVKTSDALEYRSLMEAHTCLSPLHADSALYMAATSLLFPRHQMALAGG